LRSITVNYINLRVNDIDDIYKFITTETKKAVKKKKQKNAKNTQSFDSEVEMFKKILKGETVPAYKITKIKPCLTQEWIDKCVKK
jgi:hypothetical protein